MANPVSKSLRSRARTQRLQVRMTIEQKSLVEGAAALQGLPVANFVLTSVQEAAWRVIEEHPQIKLSVHDTAAFVDALLEPKPLTVVCAKQ
jgi:uncharacterized protein (DUF1778 family)